MVRGEEVHTACARQHGLVELTNRHIPQSTAPTGILCYFVWRQAQVPGSQIRALLARRSVVRLPPLAACPAPLTGWIPDLTQDRPAMGSD